jgi:peptidoglycan/xylan/chitin deacetylase (PgdA/CDA1 family)
MRKVVAITIGLVGLIVAALLIRPGPVVRWLARRYPEVLFHLQTEEPLIALTIDDSPHPAVTPHILDVLAEHDAHATFFVIGEYVPGNEEIVQRLVAQGNELGNHLMSDAPSYRLPAAEFERQLLQTHELLAPYGPLRWCRPGHGWFNRRMLGQLHGHGYRCAMASAYSLEFRATSARYAARHILLNAHPGAVIVLHDGVGAGRQTVAVLRRVLPELQRRGYRVVTLSELAGSHEADER